MTYSIEHHSRSGSGDTFKRTGLREAFRGGWSGFTPVRHGTCPGIFTFVLFSI
jgi:hypothetical protein